MERAVHDRGGWPTDAAIDRSEHELAALDPRSIDSAAVAEGVCDRIAATGALDDARARALEVVNEAKAGLPDGLSARQRHALELVATGVVARYA